MDSGKKPRNIRELQLANYRVLPVKEELRKNLILKMRKGERFFPGIIGYEETVVPQLENAILAGHDIVFLGERGQAKTRIMRSLINLLDEEVPVIKGCEINDNPFKPICKSCQRRLENDGQGVEIEWIRREQRYGEKLATPDTTIADLIGEVDPIRVAEGRYLSDELTIHYGLIPRTNRGIFCINELPDLAERIQVGLFNVLEERDIQIRGYKIRLPLDIYLVASANPEDYTSRGRIITPLKDRYGSQIRTHYPRSHEDEIKIMELECNCPPIDSSTGKGGEVEVVIPEFMKEIIAETTALARKSPEINQRSGVSVRVSISDYELMIANAQRRAITLGEKKAVPRVSDLPSILASLNGKVELESVEEGAAMKLLEGLLKKSVVNTFNYYFSPDDFSGLVEKFTSGIQVETSENLPASKYVEIAEALGGLGKALEKLKLKSSPAETASALEFILEGLHINRKLNKDRLQGRTYYRS